MDGLSRDITCSCETLIQVPTPKILTTYPMPKGEGLLQVSGVYTTSNWWVMRIMFSSLSKKKRTEEKKRNPYLGQVSTACCTTFPWKSNIVRSHLAKFHFLQAIYSTNFAKEIISHSSLSCFQFNCSTVEHIWIVISVSE